MNQTEIIISRLTALRERIKKEHSVAGKRVPAVCTDAAINEMARLIPRKTEDFGKIKGLGPAFVANYGKRFLEQVSKALSAEAGIDATAGVNATLKELEKKLVNINKRNRLLYTGKVAAKYAFDMSEIFGADGVESLLFGKAKAVELCDVTAGGKEAEAHKPLITLMREGNKDIRERGQNDMFVGYPFVEGIAPDNEFLIKAPVMLFPVVLYRNNAKIMLKSDDTRDVLYNNSLILAYQKFNNINKPLPSDICETEGQGAVAKAVEHYLQHGIEIKGSGTSGALMPFGTEDANLPAKSKKAGLALRRSALLGRFAAYSSNLQRDFDQIIEGGKINSNLSALLEFYDEAAIDTDSYLERERAAQVSVDEDKLIYINSLNGSQERVIAKVKSGSNLVIQGPPGTGKSQVIASIIADCAAEGKSVVMVSEKKAALDVVYSRLGPLSKWAMLIDDAGNKDSFYAQLERLIDDRSKPSTGMLDMLTASGEIGRELNRLELIKSKLYCKGEYGVAAYKLYRDNVRIDFGADGELELYKLYKSHTAAGDIGLSYEELTQAQRIISDSVRAKGLGRYKDFARQYPWLNKVRSGMGEFDSRMFSDAAAETAEMIREYGVKGWLARVTGKGRLRRNVRRRLKQYFVKLDRKTVKGIIAGAGEFCNGAALYPEFDDLKRDYEYLSPAGKIYFDNVYALSRVSARSIADINIKLLDYMVFDYLDAFERGNREVLKNVDEYPKILSGINHAIAKKQQYATEFTARVLKNCALNLNASKRISEIRRGISGKRRSGVKRFVERFGFELIRGVKIWLMTPEAVSEIMPLEMGIFDMVVFDEASQMFVEKSLPAVYRAKRVVVAGDEKQLRPSNLGTGRIEFDEGMLDNEVDLPAALEEESLLDLAKYKYSTAMLDFHYRSAYEELIAFSNNAFYNGRLCVSPNTNVPSRPPIEYRHITGGLWKNRANPVEADAVIKLLKEVFAGRLNNETIGIITFNSAQRDLIMDKIDDEFSGDHAFYQAVSAEAERTENGQDVGLFIRNIENVQGDERDIIIFSVGYAKNTAGRLMKNFGWLNVKGGENRLNVAITRAKSKIYVVASFLPSELDVSEAKNKGPVMLRSYLEYAYAVSSRNDSEVARILHEVKDGGSAHGDYSRELGCVDTDKIADKVSERLSAHGFEVRRNSGIGGYVMDIAVLKGNRFVLGIELDKTVYEEVEDTRERDYHRTNYLVARGWKVYRLFCSRWWRSPDTEINNILAAAKNNK